MNKKNRENQFIKKEAQESLIDLLVDIIPSLKDVRIIMSPEFKKIDPISQKLLSIWEDESNRVAKRSYKIPVNMNKEELRTLEYNGYVAVTGSNMKITEKGAHIINEMILATDKSIYDEEKTANSNSIIKTASSKNDNFNWYSVAKR